MNYEQAIEAVNQGKKIRWSRFRRKRDHVFKDHEMGLMYANDMGHNDMFNMSPWTPDPNDKTSETWEIIDI